MSNSDATKDVNEVPAVRTRKQTIGLVYSLDIVFDRQKKLLLRLQRKSENIKNLMENKFSVRAVSEELKQYDNLISCFQEFRENIMGSLMMISRKLMILL